MNAKFGIHFGVWAKPLKEQCKEQGYMLEKTFIHPYQHYADCITSLLIGGICTDGEVEHMRKKLLQKIMRHIKPVKSRPRKIQTGG